MSTLACTPADYRLLGNIAFLAARMGWSDESDTIFGALADVVETRAQLLYAWIGARCANGDFEGAEELINRMAALPGADPQVLAMARCYHGCCVGKPGWEEAAQRITQAGSQTFGYETAQAMLDARSTVN